ncbi:MAG: pyrroline-5-carboxylate reductase [Planctomycetaceae bacterium]
MSAIDKTTHVGFIGAGRMATALARGLVSSGFIPVGHISASDVVADACKRFTEETGALAVGSAADVVKRSNVIFLSVKPQQMAGVLADLQPMLDPSHLVISIAAGVTLSTLAKGLGSRTRIVRVMPNTPCLVGQGASAYSLGEAATGDDGALVQKMLSTVGVAVTVPEKLLDAVTGLSGSGPAYVYQIIEALSDGGVLAGLPRDVATKLAAQTVLGSAQMVLETGEHPGALKDAVASPGGTTIAGLQALEAGGLRAALMNAVAKATARSIELGKSS